MSGDINLWCSMCGQLYNRLSGHACPERHSDTPQRGWVCPVCGRGNAPWKGQCDCTVADVTRPENTAPFKPWPTIGYPNQQSQTLTADDLFRVSDDD